MQSSIALIGTIQDKDIAIKMARGLINPHTSIKYETIVTGRINIKRYPSKIITTFRNGEIDKDEKNY